MIFGFLCGFFSFDFSGDSVADVNTYLYSGDAEVIPGKDIQTAKMLSELNCFGLTSFMLDIFLAH